ncbi:hypothetical protein [Pseudarthrobacter sp. YAF2]|uniref:hypothetical protein n=1 Tax=Pseudarthrobacter sp. YAF2 TaxID=3233078 RepID=UPI003F964C4F
MENLTFANGLHIMPVSALHSGYLGEKVYVSTGDNAAVIGELASFRMRIAAPTANSEPRTDVRIKVGESVLDLDGSAVVLFLDRFAPEPYSES